MLTRVLLLGASGQLGRCLQDRCPDGWDLLAPGSGQLDIRDASAIERAVAQVRPGLLINAAAYNRVDQAEREPMLAYAANADGPQYLARAAAGIGARLIHISTDYVFDGRAHDLLAPARPASAPAAPGTPVGLPDPGSISANFMRRRPYTEADPAHPLNVYGQSKLQGEQAVRRVQSDAIVLRTSWLYSEYGGNFVKAIMRRAQAGQSLEVVGDQTGSPTYAGDLADAIIRLAQCPNVAGGVYHYSGAGVLSRHGFARHIVALAGYAGIDVKLVSSAHYPAAAVRPAYSALGCEKIRIYGIVPRPLEASLPFVIQRLKSESAE